VGLGPQGVLTLLCSRKLPGGWLWHTRKLLRGWLWHTRKLLGGWLWCRRKGVTPVVLLFTGSAAAECLWLSWEEAGGQYADRKLAAGMLSIACLVEGSGALLAVVEGQISFIGDPAVHAVPQVGAYCNLVERQYQHGLQHQHKQQTSSYTAVHWVAGGQCCCMIILCSVAGTRPRGELAAGLVGGCST
jgi:hypothetical protein